MFDLFRSRAKAVRILLGALLVLVALSMVTYLIPGVGTNLGSEGMVVAEFGKETLTLPEVQRVVQTELRGQNIPPQMASVFVPQYVDQIITELQHGRAKSVTVTIPEGWRMEQVAAKLAEAGLGKPEEFRALMRNAMQCDYSWKHPARHYLNIFHYIRDK